MAVRKSPAALLAEAETIAQIQHRIQSQKKPKREKEPEEFWAPSLGPTQQRIFDSGARFIFAYGERYSGKTWGILHKLVRHAWMNHGAHVLIIVGVRRQATAGGSWTKLLEKVLPEWESNLEGFEYNDPRQTQEKDVILEMKNRHGTKSLFHLVSIPHGGRLADRIKGIEATAVFVDEIVGIGGEEYFNAIIQQLGRRVDVPISEQFYAAAANPAGPSHWAYKTFIEGAFLPNGTPDARYLTVHLPINENPDPRAQEYYRDFVLPAVKNDPIEHQRMVEGIWVDRPSGDSLFAGYFVPGFHIKGSTKDGSILHPATSRTITIGYDLGDVNSCCEFMQDRFTKEQTIWLAIDELVFTDKPIAYEQFVPLLLDKMNYWCDLEQHHFIFDHISDRSAFDRFRAATGSYDHQMIEKLSRQHLQRAPERWPWLKSPIRMRECPKPPGSVAARIKLMREMLSNKAFFLSEPKVPRLIDALKSLESKPDKPMEPARSPHLHPYDAATYVLYFNSLGGPVVPAEPPVSLKPQVTGFGS